MESEMLSIAKKLAISRVKLKGQGKDLQEFNQGLGALHCQWAKRNVQ
jgi:hypothetical protein